MKSTFKNFTRVAIALFFVLLLSLIIRLVNSRQLSTEDYLIQGSEDLSAELAAQEPSAPDTARGKPNETPDAAVDAKPPQAVPAIDKRAATQGKDRLLGDVIAKLFRGESLISSQEIERALKITGRTAEALLAAARLETRREAKQAYLRESLSKQKSRSAYLALLADEPKDKDLLAAYKAFDPDNLATVLMTLPQDERASLSEKFERLRKALKEKKLLLGSNEEKAAVSGLLQAAGYGEEPSKFAAAHAIIRSELAVLHPLEEVRQDLFQKIDYMQSEIRSTDMPLPREEFLTALTTLAHYERLDNTLIGRIVETSVLQTKAIVEGDAKLSAMYRRRDDCLSKVSQPFTRAIENLTYEEVPSYMEGWAKKGELGSLLALDTVRDYLEEKGCLDVLERMAAE